MTITEARAVLTDAGRNVTAATNDNTNLDYAIQAAGNEFVSRTRCVIGKQTIILSAAAIASILAAEFPDGFRPDMIIKARIQNSDKDFHVVSYDELRLKQVADASEGTPQLMAFQSTTSNDAEIWPATDGPHTLEFSYYAPFTRYTAGATGGDAEVELNIPEDMIRPVINCGAVYYLLKNMPEHADWVDRCRRDFEQHIQNHMHRASTGVRSAPRAMAW